MIESLSETEEQIIIGSLLGDGCLTVKRTYRNPLFQESHSIKQKEYIQWKGKNLKTLSPSIRIYYNKVFFTFGIRFRTRCDSRLLPYYKAFYQPKKILSLKYLQKLKSLGLAVWFQDDGGIDKKNRRARIATHNFTLSEHKLLKLYFEEKWSISPTIYRREIDKKYHLCFTVKETGKLIDIIKSYIHPIMGYKIKIKPYINNYNRKEVCHAF